VSEERHGAHVDREDVDGLFNARTGPGSGAFGTLGTEAGSDLNWFSLLRYRVRALAEGSSRHQWCVRRSTRTVFVAVIRSIPRSRSEKSARGDRYTLNL
jgi:hypothetical protein